jgi:isopentenyl diphosphate isomerase/L-lactate dehydrogenase-like FMN-dependent dehydrogenase
MRHNREAFERWRIVPRMLHGVTQRDLSTSILGTQLSSPLLLALIGAASLVAGNSDVIIARGAAAAKTPYVISSQGCNPMEETAAAMGSTPFWYQLYWSTDEGLVDSMIKRAENCGAQALVVTLDTTILGWRPRDLNLGRCRSHVAKALRSTRPILDFWRLSRSVSRQPGLPSVSSRG